MRYSFHGKVRATGQPVDGYVEAPTASLAIDRLADRGIIGVYSVRPEPKPPKNAVRLDGEPAPEEDKPAPRLEAPAPVKAENGSEVVFATLVDKLGSLLVQVEKLLSRPPQQQVIYQSGGLARDRGDHSNRPRRPHPNMESSSTLRDIFQTNLDLRQSLEKLANSTGTSNRITDAAARVGEAATRLTEAAADSNGGESTPAEPKTDETNGTHTAETDSAEPAAHGPTPREPVKARELVDAQPAA